MYTLLRETYLEANVLSEGLDPLLKTIGGYNDYES
jgi:hypothetical protein